MNEADLSCRLRLEKGFLVAFDTPSSAATSLSSSWQERFEKEPISRGSMFQKQAETSLVIVLFQAVCPVWQTGNLHVLWNWRLGRRRPRRMKMGGRSLIWQNWQLREIGSSPQLSSAHLRRNFTRRSFTSAWDSISYFIIASSNWMFFFQVCLWNFFLKLLRFRPPGQIYTSLLALHVGWVWGGCCRGWLVVVG